MPSPAAGPARPEEDAARASTARGRRRLRCVRMHVHGEMATGPGGRTSSPAAGAVSLCGSSSNLFVSFTTGLEPNLV